VARLELEIKQQAGEIKRSSVCWKNDNLFDLSGGLEQYRGASRV
jgi:type III restriction enzyme